VKGAVAVAVAMPSLFQHMIDVMTAKEHTDMYFKCEA